MRFQDTFISDGKAQGQKRGTYKKSGAKEYDLFSDESEDEEEEDDENMR